MGVISSFLIQLNSPRTVREIEKGARDNMKLVQGRVELIHPKAIIESNEFTNIINFYSENSQEYINGVIEYLTDVENKRLSEIRCNGYYSSFILDINTRGYEEFIEDLKIIFDAKKISLETY